jgi:hypothetical protein
MLRDLRRAFRLLIPLRADAAGSAQYRRVHTGVDRGDRDSPHGSLAA